MITLRMGPEQRADPFNQPVGRTLMGYRPGLSERECWERTRGVWLLDQKRVLAEQFVVVMDHDCIVRAVAEIDGIEQYGKKLAIVGRLFEGHPLVGRASPWINTAQNGVGYFKGSPTSEIAILEPSYVRGSGFELDQAVREKVEAHAIAVAKKHFARNWSVADVHRSESFDLLCTNNDSVAHVAVKGTTTGCEQVLLTRNEVLHARSFPHAILFIVSGINVHFTRKGDVSASGGSVHIWDPWLIDDHQLEPIGYWYRTPEESPLMGQ
jgi:hypothetical protein